MWERVCGRLLRVPSTDRAPLRFSLSHPAITYSSSLAVSSGAPSSHLAPPTFTRELGSRLGGCQAKTKTKNSKQKDPMKPKIRRKDLLLASSEENTGDLSQSSVSPTEIRDLLS